MFFSVGLEQDRRFPNSYQFDTLWVNLDSGWQQHNNQFYKGYADNHCEIVIQDTGITVKHSSPRSFPMWFQHGAITNLYPGEWQRAWISDGLQIQPSGEIVWTPVSLDLTVPADVLSVDRAVQQIQTLLNYSVTELPHAVRLFCSGGLDTFLLYSMLTYHGCEFDLLQDEHFESDQFIDLNREALETYWSYNRLQLHHWNQPVWLATGGHGDEYFLRGPAVIALLTAWHDIDFGAVLAQNTTAYHYHHFNKYSELWATSWQQRDNLRQQYPTRDVLNQQIMDILGNDHQHWHLGQTITWTPLKNIEIARILLQCDIADLVPQFLDGSITRKIIQHYCPDVLNFVSAYKNHNYKEKLNDFFHWHRHA
jgi:hypothetical protein